MSLSGSGLKRRSVHTRISPRYRSEYCLLQPPGPVTSQAWGAKAGRKEMQTPMVNNTTKPRTAGGSPVAL